MDSRPQSPRVYEYLEVTHFLQDYYKFRKQHHKGFSYESWATELELNSRSFLRLMVSGKKKISARFCDAFSRLNFATKNEEAYFLNLVKLSQAKTSKDRQIYNSKMMQILKHEHSAAIVTEKTEYVAEPLLPRLLSLLCFSDFRATAKKCAHILKIDLVEIQNALNKLEDMKLIEKVEAQGETAWIALHDVFHVPDNYGSFDLLKFHEKSLSDAVAAFHLPKELRRYKSLLMPLDEASLEKFNKALEAFIAEQLLAHNSKKSRGSYLYQVNFNFHPVSEKMTGD